MNRNVTNVIRFFMDECIPPLIRDNKYFMYPFFYYAYRGRNIREVMNFKSLVYDFTEQEYDRFYNNLNTISRNRLTDLNKPSLDYILNNINSSAVNLIDIGCGHGYLLRQIKNAHPSLALTGFDIKDKAEENSVYEYKKGNIDSLPFPDKSFDVVVCSHTVEHLLNLDIAIKELKRITKKQLFIVTPCQRYYYYTLDEHVNFFPFKEKLTSVINIKNHICKKVWGDWVYLGTLDQ